MRRLLVAGLAALALAGAGAPHARTAPPAHRYWLVFSSDRDETGRGYSIRPDGSRLTSLLPQTDKRVPNAISRDGTTIVYSGPHWFYVGRANGTRLHRVTQEGVGPVLSPDKRRLAVTDAHTSNIWVVGTDGRGLRRLTSGKDDGPDWSPDGKTIVFHRAYGKDGEKAQALFVRPLRGRSRMILRRPGPGGLGSPAWSPDGRWIAYGENGLWLIRPDGRARHQVVRDFIWARAWSPDGSRLAVAVGPGTILVVDVNGRVLRRLRLRVLDRFDGIARIAWSPDARRLAIEMLFGQLPQIWVVGVDGRGLRRISRGGDNTLLGWTPLAPVQPPAPPIPPTERISGPAEVTTREPVYDLSADGGRVAFSVSESVADCTHVVVWTPATRGLDRFTRRAPCPQYHGAGGVYGIALAGSRVGWVKVDSCGNSSCDVTLETATLEQRAPVSLADGSFDSEGDDADDFGLRGHGDLLVFDDGSRLVRIGAGTEQCGGYFMCTTLRRGAHSAPADSVSAGLIAVRERDAVSILDARGNLVRYFPFPGGEVTAARLDGGRLVVARRGLIEVYDVSTGAGVLQRPMPSGYELDDVDGGIAVLGRESEALLLRLDDGRSFTLEPRRAPVRADLEPPGLYYAYATRNGGSRIVFMPRSEVLQKLAGSAG
jgi:Tol biopolymer transport system component